MTKVLIFVIIFILIISTSLIKNSTKELDEQIYSLKENIIFLDDRFKDSKLEFDYLSSSEKLLEYQKLYFENSLLKKSIIPSSQEIKENQPSRSAKLRYIIKNDNSYEIDTDLVEKFSNLLEIENLGSKL